MTGSLSERGMGPDRGGSGVLLLLRVIRILAGGIGLTMLAILPLIALNLARFGDLALTRFRGPTYVLWAAVVVIVLARLDPLSKAIGFAARMRDLFSEPRFFPAMAGVGLVVYVLAAATQYLSFNTFSHDLSIFDESLYNTVRGNFLYTSVLGRNFFSQHFSPTLLLLLPLYAAGAKTTVLVVVHPVVLWAAVLVLRDAAKSSNLTPDIQNLVCLVYLGHPIAVHTLSYVFHIEALLPLLVFSAWASYRRNRLTLFWLMLVLMLGIKEDVGIYVAGLGLYLLVGRRRPVLGALVCAAGIAWTWMAVSAAIPAFGGSDSHYAFLSRWGQWGGSIFGVVWGWITHPLEFASSLVNTRIVKYLACLAFLPLVGRWTWLLIAGPWILNATSALEIQSRLGLYYGIPFLAFGLVASIEVLRGDAGGSQPVRKWAPALAAVAIVLNVANFTFPEVPRCRPAVVEAIRSIPEDARVAAMPCLYPVLDRRMGKTLIWPRRPSDADFEILRTDHTTRPFTPTEITRRIERRLGSGRWESWFEVDDFVILRRTPEVDALPETMPATSATP